MSRNTLFVNFSVYNYYSAYNCCQRTGSKVWLIYLKQRVGKLEGNYLLADLNHEIDKSTFILLYLIKWLLFSWGRKKFLHLLQDIQWKYLALHCVASPPRLSPSAVRPRLVGSWIGGLRTAAAQPWPGSPPPCARRTSRTGTPACAWNLKMREFTKQNLHDRTHLIPLVSDLGN